MAQVEQSSGDDNKKTGDQKKMHIHVDFTPMVDMNMLLITFFMLCTTMLKSQTLNIILPSNDKVEKDQMNKAKQSDSFTIIIDAERVETKDGKPGAIKGNYVYYYKGKPGGEAGISADNVVAANNIQEPAKGNGNVNGGVVDLIRDVLREENAEVVRDLDKLQLRYQKEEISAEEFQKQSYEIVNTKEYKKKPVVIIKATRNASFDNLVSALDEMQINGISTFQINDMLPADSILLDDYLKKHPRK